MVDGAIREDSAPAAGPSVDESGIAAAHTFPLSAVVRRRFGAWLLLGMVVLMATVMAWDASEPWAGGTSGWNGALFSAAARNHVRYGFGTTKFGVVVNQDVAEPEDFQYYTRHPPLLPVFVATSFMVFGVHEWSARLVPILFSLGSLLLVVALGTELGGAGLGLVAGFFFALLPMNAVYGRMVDHEALTNFFCLAAALAYWRWHRGGDRRLLYLVVGAMVLGGLCGWPAYYLGLLLPLHYVIVTPRHRWNWRIAVLPVAMGALFGIHLLHIIWLQGGDGVADLITAFWYRTSRAVADQNSATITLASVEAAGAGQFGWGAFAAREAVEANNFFTTTVLLLAVLSLYTLARRRETHATADRWFPIMLLAFGLLHLGLFRQGAWIHDYWAFYCGAPLALLAAHGTLVMARHDLRSWAVAFVAVTFVMNAIPEIAYFRQPLFPDQPGLGQLLNQRTESGDEIYTNGPDLSARVGYYAQRELHRSPLVSVAQLEEVVRAARDNQIVVLIAKARPGAEELNAWLVERYGGEDLDDDRTYRIFRISPPRPGS